MKCKKGHKMRLDELGWVCDECDILQIPLTMKENENGKGNKIQSI